MTIAELTECCGGEVRTGPFGSQLHKADYVDEEKATPVVMPKDMIDGHIDVASIARIDDEARDRLSQHVLSAGDIVLGRRGDIGRRAWVGDAESGWLCGTGSMRISLRSCPRVRARYLYYYLATDAAIGWLEGHAVGATMSNLSAGVVEQLPVEFPDVAHQDVIVGVLDSINRLIGNNRRRIAILEEMARLIYREWFVHFRFPGHEDVELVDSDLGPIPEGWKVRPLSAVLELAYGKALKADDRRGGDVAVYGSGGIVGWHDEALVDGPGIVVGRKGNVGAVYWSDVDFYPIDTTYFVKSEMPLSFVYHQLQTLEFIDSHAAVPGLSRDQAYSLRVVVPARGALSSFDNTVSPMYELRRNLIAQNDVLTNARDLLLPRLISGELDVSVLDLDLEPVA